MLDEIKLASVSITEVNDTTGYVDFECTLKLPDNEGFVHLQGRVNVTKLPPE